VAGPGTGGDGMGRRRYGATATSETELLSHRSGWHRNRLDITAAVADLGTAAVLVDLDPPPDDPRAPSARLPARPSTSAPFDPSDLSRVPFPSWVTTPIPEAVINLHPGPAQQGHAAPTDVPPAPARRHSTRSQKVTGRGLTTSHPLPRFEVIGPGSS